MAEIMVTRLDRTKMERLDLVEGQNPVWMDLSSRIVGPVARILFEEWRPEAQSTTSWTFTFYEVHYALRGKAEITYTSPPYHFSESKKTITVEAGDVYLIPIGTRWTRKVIGEEPYLHLCIIINPPAPAQISVGK
jgi:mannose-6-phosphate isomerase-like protein (cupin superfamily)